MAPLDPQKTTYSDTTPQRRAITDLVSIISPRDTPLIARFGLSASPPAGWKIVNWPSTAVECLEDELHPTSDALDGSITSTATTITVDDQSVFHEGDVLLIGTEYVWVSARSASGQVLTVVRSFGGTTNATHADNATVTIVGNARLEGADTNDSSFMDIGSQKNWTQIFHEGVKVSRTAQKISQYGIAGEFEYQQMKKTQDLLKKMEIALVRGKLASGSGTTARAMGGLDYWINSAGGNTVSAGGAVTQADFEDALELAYADGGMPRVAVVSPANMQVIKNFYDASSFLRVDRTETTVGMTIQTIVTPFGEVELLMSRYVPDTIIPIIDPDHYALLAYDMPFFEELAQSGDYLRGQVVAEVSCLVRHPLKAHAEIIAIS